MPKNYTFHTFFFTILQTYSGSSLKIHKYLAVYAKLGRMRLSKQMCARLAKFWLRIKSPTSDNTLVGKARDVCLDLYTKPVSFITHFLKLCGVKMKDFKSFNIYLKES